MNDFTAKAKGLFDRNPETIRYFFTSDSQAFENFHHADFHASNLRDGTITEVYRPEMSEAEIKQFKDAEALKAQTELEGTLKRLWPELMGGSARKNDRVY